MKSHFIPAFALLALSIGSTHAAITAVTVSDPIVTNAGSTSATFNLTENSVDWYKYNASGNTDTKKSGATVLTSTAAPGSPGNFTAGDFTFTWTDGINPTSGTQTNMENRAATGTYFWEVTATGLAAGSYQMDLYAARTDDTPFSVEIYDNGVFNARKTVNGDTINDGNTVDYITNAITFTTDGASPVQFRFVRDTTNGTIGSTPAADSVLAIGAWKLTSVPEPSSSALFAMAGLGMLLRRRR